MYLHASHCTSCASMHHHQNRQLWLTPSPSTHVPPHPTAIMQHPNHHILSPACSSIPPPSLSDSNFRQQSAGYDSGRLGTLHHWGAARPTGEGHVRVFTAGQPHQGEAASGLEVASPRRSPSPRSPASPHRPGALVPEHSLLLGRPSCR